MKRTLAHFLTMLIIVTLSLSLFACTEASDSPTNDNLKSDASNTNATTPEERLKYGERYVLETEDGNEGFIFNSNGTGEYHIWEVIWDKTEKTIKSGYVKFDWRSASDGAIHLFKNGETQLKDNNTYGNFNLDPVKMLFVSEDFVTYYEYESGYNIDITTGVGKAYSDIIKTDYIRAGSSLDKKD